MRGNQHEQLNRSIIALLFKLVKVDNKGKAPELSYIYKVGESIGVPEEDILAIQTDLLSYHLRPPSSEQDRMTILYYLLFLMKVNEEIRDEEIRFIKEFSFKLGFRSEMTDEMIQIVKDNVNEKLSPDTLLHTICKYNN